MNQSISLGTTSVSGELIDDGAIPEGEYAFNYVDYITCMAFNVPRVLLRMKICDPGPYLGRLLERWYPVTFLKGEQKKFGDYAVGKRSDLFRELTKLGLAKGARTDRISLSVLKGKTVIGRVGTVTKDRRRSPLPKESHYSVIRELLRIE